MNPFSYLRNWIWTPKQTQDASQYTKPNRYKSSQSSSAMLIPDEPEKSNPETEKSNIEPEKSNG